MKGIPWGNEKTWKTPLLRMRGGRNNVIVTCSHWCSQDSENTGGRHKPFTGSSLHSVGARDLAWLSFRRDSVSQKNREPEREDENWAVGGGARSHPQESLENQVTKATRT